MRPLKTEHALDWSKTFPEIADQFERMAIERDRYREALRGIITFYPPDEKAGFLARKALMDLNA